MSIIGDIINKQHEEAIDKLKATHAEEQDVLLAENEALEFEVQISRKTLQRFLDGEAPTVCDECHEKLYNACGILLCSHCKRGWDPREDEWLWTE
jgi:formylmethanofuran dehydrogenase subunit E